MPTLALTTSSMITLGTAAVVALAAVILLVFGERLTKPLYVLTGLLAGAAMGMVLAPIISNTSLTSWLVPIGAAVFGAALAALFFRLWIGLSMACMLAIAVPATVIVWQGIPEPTMPFIPQATQPFRITITTQPDAQRLKELAEIRMIDVNSFNFHLKEFVRRHQRDVREIARWWSSLSSGGQKEIAISALAGAAFGFFLGLLMPRTASGVQSAGVGAVLLMVAIRAAWLVLLDRSVFNLANASTRQSIVAMGLITLAGLGIQRALRARSADKSKEKKP